MRGCNATNLEAVGSTGTCEDVLRRATYQDVQGRTGTYKRVLGRTGMYKDVVGCMRACLDGLGCARTHRDEE
eukprot:1224966-Alexandrium_andersonii.AAC.1